MHCLGGGAYQGKGLDLTQQDHRLSAEAALVADVVDAQVLDFSSLAPSHESSGVKRWTARGRNWVLDYAEIESSVEFEYEGATKEHIVVTLDAGTSCILDWNGQTTELPGEHLAIVPPGRATTKLAGRGRLLRLFTTEAAGLAAGASNAGSYSAADQEVSGSSGLMMPTPAVRTYSLDVEPQPGRFGRIFTTADLMVNFLEPRPGPRDRRALSPHSHVDFDQSSFVTSGTYIHHLRWPWGKDATLWREDVHVIVGSPSVTVIPPQVIHTSEAIGEGVNVICDIFSPPRKDWRDAQWVINAADYEEVSDKEAGNR
jgi:mannose-6-phosphate isomerase-like protein (cupin superfamily)